MLINKLLGPAGVGRSLALQVAIYSVGNGLFLAGSMIFFTKVVGLSPVEVGLGLSIAGIASAITSIPFGVLTDRVGARRSWLMAIFIEAALFTAYPFSRGFVTFVALVVCVSLAATVGDAGRNNYTLEIIPADQRVRVMAYQRTALNIGFSAGAGLAALALWIGTTWAYYSLPIGYALVLLVNAMYVTRLPASPVASAAHKRHTSAAAVFRDGSYMVWCVVNAVLAVHETIFAVVVPLWILNRTDAPTAIVAMLLIMNTVIVIVLQVPLSRGGEDIPSAARALLRAGFSLAAGCVVLAFTSLTSGMLTIGLLLLANLLITFAEMLQSTGEWGIRAHLAPEAMRGQYQGALRMARKVQQILAPTVLIALTVSGGGLTGWLILGGVLALCGVAASPIVNWAARSPRLGTSEPTPVTVSASS